MRMAETWKKLTQLQDARTEMQLLQKRMRSLKDSLYGFSVQCFDYIPKSSHGTGDRMADLVANLVDTEDLYADKVVKMWNLIAEMDFDYIDKLDPEDAAVVRMHGMDGMKIEDVARKMHISRREVAYRYSAGIKALAEMEPQN